jgi:hypothetical protein
MMERQELFDALTDAMRGSARDDVLGGGLRPGRVKSRLIEAHAPEASSDGTQHLLESVAEPAGLTIETVGDELWALTSSDATFVVDGLNPRFWLLHSTASAEQLRRLLTQHILPSSRLDSAWFSGQQLLNMEGERRWVRSSFDSATLQPRESGATVPRRWRVQVEGENPDELLELVSQTERYRAGAALTAVASTLDTPDGGKVEVAADYQGGFVASGDDFHTVAGVLWRTLDAYEGYIRGLEAAFRLGTTGTEAMGMTVEGDVATIEFPHEVGDLDALANNLFTCREPFRLWAVPREVCDGQWEANAVDLHVGHVLRLEFTSRWLRVMLEPGTCGNTLARLVANLQHRFDARVQLPIAAAALS